MKLKVTLNGVIEGIQSYMSLSLEGKSKSIDSIQLAIEEANKAVKTVQGRKFVTKYAFASKDKVSIIRVTALLRTALKALMTKIQLSNHGALRGQNITSEKINENAVVHFRESENTLKFWRDFVTNKSWQLNTQKAAFYMTKFVEAYNTE